MIAITPQMRVLVCIEPADFRNYAEPPVMQSNLATGVSCMPKLAFLLRIIRLVSVGLEHCQ